MRRLLGTLAALLLAWPASGALVVFEDGRHLRVAGFEVVEERVTLKLPGGGELTIPLERVDRIIDDELDPRDYAPPPPPRADLPAEKGPSVRAAAEAWSSGRLPFGPLIRRAGTAHRVDPALVAAVIAAESAFQPRAISRKGARGLMQLMPATARRLGVARVHDPEENVLGGTAYLSELADRFGEDRPDLVLAAYNAGERAVEEHGGVPPYRETQAYVAKVLRIWGELRGAPAGAS